MDQDLEQAREQLLKLLDQFPALTREMQLLSKAAKTSKDFEKSIKDLNKQIDKGKAGYKNQLEMIDRLSDSIEDLDEEIRDATDEVERNSKIDQKATLERKKAELESAAAIRGVSEAAAEFTTVVGTQAIQGAGAFVKSLQDNVGAVQLTNTVLNAGIDAVALGGKAAGKGLQALGDALAPLGPWGRGASIALNILGIAAETASEGVAKLAKFGLEVVSKEVEKTVKAFSEVSASGAMFADGVTGMRNAAAGSGLTLQQFSEVVKNQSANIAASGLGVSEGIRRIGEVGKVLKTSGMQTQLQNLGYSFQEQAELTAEVMKDMRGAATGPLRASNQQVAEQTAKYAENLRVITAITGEDAKKKIEQAREQSNQLMFQQNLANLDEKQRQEIIAAMGLMGKQQQKDLMDMVNFGSIINTTGAVLSSTSSSYSSLINESAELIRKGNLNTETYLDIAGKHNTQIQTDFLAQRSIAATQGAGLSGIGSEVAVAMMELINEIKNQTPEAIEEAKKQAAAQKETTDKATTSLMGAANAAQELAVNLEKALIPAVEKYGQVSNAILSTFRDALIEAGLADEETKAKYEEAQQQAVKEKYAGNDSNQIMRNIYKLWEGRDLETGEKFNAADMLSPSFAQKPSNASANDLPGAGKAKGGISTGPVSGYSEILHGTEAVVPLPDNRSIPVKLDSGSITTAMADQTAMLREILSAMQANNNINGKILQNSY